VVEPTPIPSPGIPLYFGEVGAPLVVVLHDWFGRLPGVVDYGEALARVGLRVAVPDLYGGFCTTDDEVAERLLTDLDYGRSLALIDDVIRHERATGSGRVATVGFSMGGELALSHARTGATDAVVAYYATLEPNHGIIPCPVLLQLAEHDEWPPGGEPEAFVARLAEHGTPVTQHTYLATEHSFANASIARSFARDAAALSFARVARFLEQHLAD
jgi:carboxymethylenebutenolidase